MPLGITSPKLRCPRCWTSNALPILPIWLELLGFSSDTAIRLASMALRKPRVVPSLDHTLDAASDNAHSRSLRRLRGSARAISGIDHFRLSAPPSRAPLRCSAKLGDELSPAFNARGASELLEERRRIIYDEIRHTTCWGNDNR